jgi:hypothetical protein
MKVNEHFAYFRGELLNVGSPSHHYQIAKDLEDALYRFFRWHIEANIGKVMGQSLGHQGLLLVSHCRKDEGLEDPSKLLALFQMPSASGHEIP